MMNTPAHSTINREVSPAIPAQSDLESTFVPAEIMTSTNRILPEKLVLASGEPVGGMSFERASFAQDIPQPVLPQADADPAAIQGAAEFAPGARPITRQSSAHVFVDMSLPIPITTAWEVEKPMAVTMGHDVTPILPASRDAMINAGEGYTIRAAESGKVIATTQLPAIQASLAAENAHPNSTTC
jgi:hypothetical protein